MNSKKMRYNCECNQLKNGIKKCSFERFCDDLCVYLLSYLPLRDKVRLECVSKQWNRCVFATQECLSIKNFDENGLSVYNLYKFYKNHEIVINVCAKLFNRCLLINNIELVILYFNNINDKYLLTIANNCKQLSTLKFNAEYYSEEAIKQFGEMCGNQLKCLKLNESKCQTCSKRQQLIKLCPNLTRIKCVVFSDIICENHLLVSKLYDLVVTRCHETHLMDILVNNCKRY
jgi:hypothetical protein